MSDPTPTGLRPSLRHERSAARDVLLYRTARDARSDTTYQERANTRYTPKLDNATSREWTREGGGHGRAGASDNPVFSSEQRRV